MKKVFFILACLPLFLGFHVSGDFVFYPGILFPIIFLACNRTVSIHLIILWILAFIFALFNTINLVSLLYYLFGLTYIFNRIQFRKEWVESTFNAVIIICFITIIFDFLGIRLVDFLTTYERRLMLDVRSGLTFVRPTGFFREPSALGLLLGVIYGVGFINSLKIRYNLLIISGLLTFTGSFFLLLLYSFILYSRVRFKLIKTFTVFLTILFIFKDRIYGAFLAFQRSDLTFVELNLSEVKRYVQPVYAMFEYIQESSLFNRFVGYGPGGYKEYLQQKYSYIIGSDLGAGYLLNIFGNYMMAFGLFFALIFLAFLRKKYSLKEFMLVLFLFFQGVAVVDPVFLLAAIKIKK